MSNACNLILWKVANGDVVRYERICFCFSNMIKLLNNAKMGMYSAMESSARRNYILANLSSSMAETEAHAEMLIETGGNNSDG